MLLEEVSHGDPPIRKWWWCSGFYSTTVHVGVHALVRGNDTSAAISLRNRRSQRTNCSRRFLSTNISWKTGKSSGFSKWYETISFILFLKKSLSFSHHWRAGYLWEIVESICSVFGMNCWKKIRSLEHVRRFYCPYVRFCKILWFSLIRTSFGILRETFVSLQIYCSLNIITVISCSNLFIICFLYDSCLSSCGGLRTVWYG